VKKVGIGGVFRRRTEKFNQTKSLDPSLGSVWGGGGCGGGGNHYDSSNPKKRGIRGSDIICSDEGLFINMERFLETFFSGRGVYNHITKERVTVVQIGKNVAKFTQKGGRGFLEGGESLVHPKQGKGQIFWSGVGGTLREGAGKKTLWSFISKGGWNRGGNLLLETRNFTGKERKKARLKIGARGGSLRYLQRS